MGSGLSTPREPVAEAIVSAHRLDWVRLLGGLASELRDLDLAEDALADAFESAVRTWPETGVPASPAGWLRTAARRKALDMLRRRQTAQSAVPALGLTAQRVEEDSAESPRLADRIGDERLQLILACTHPALTTADQLALALRCVAGLSTTDVARLLLSGDDAMAARLKRARKKASTLPAAFAVPDWDEVEARLPHARQCCYLIFTEGYAPNRGGDTRAELMDEGIRLTRLLLEIVPSDDATQALLALMLLQSSRRDARLDADGHQVLLRDQDRARWRTWEIDEARGILAGLTSAEPEPYLLQALIADALIADDPSWDTIELLLHGLHRIAPSPLLTLQRAVVVAERDGSQAGLDVLESVREDLARHPQCMPPGATCWRATTTRPTRWRRTARRSGCRPTTSGSPPGSARSSGSRATERSRRQRSGVSVPP